MTIRNIDCKYQIRDAETHNTLSYCVNIDSAKNKLHNISKNKKINCYLINIFTNEIVKFKEFKK